MNINFRITTLALAAAFIATFFSSFESAPGSIKKSSRKDAIERRVKILDETATFRLVKHPWGKSKVPLIPKKIASLSAVITDSLVALDIKPVVVAGGWKSNKPAAYLAGRLEGTPTIGRSGIVNLEALYYLCPDLILTSNLQDRRLYEQLGKIAPTVYIDADSVDRREDAVVDIGGVVGKFADAKRLLEAYQQTVRKTHDQLAAGESDRSVVFLRFRMGTCVVYSQNNMFGPLLFQELGLKPDPIMPANLPMGGWDVLSLERMSLLTADHLFYCVDGDCDRYFQDVAKTPIWQGIPAVRKGKLHRVESSLWIGGEGVLASQAILRDIMTAMNPERSL
jgi:iron complex transport system substrate-binding protein